MTESPDDRLGRRLLVLRVAATGGSAALASPALAQGTKGPGGNGGQVPDPSPPGARPGISDADPNDPPGQGRGGSGPRRGGVSDADPNDPAGQGRGGSGPRQGGVSDADPSDPPGQGRGRGGGTPPPSGPSDSDPSDPPGRGRGRQGPIKV